MHPRVRNASGNVALFLAITLGTVFAVGGLAIDTTLFLLKRQEIQALAEDVALAAALSLPDPDATQDAAESWYSVLRFDGDRAIAEEGDIEVEITDNIDQGVTPGGAVAYSVDSVSVTISIQYSPQIFPLGDLTPEIFTISGTATARLKPVDVVLIVENSSSFYVQDQATLEEEGVVSITYADPEEQGRVERCYGTPWRQFKRGVIQLYDLLTIPSSFRAAVILTNSRAQKPYFLTDFGNTQIAVADMEDQSEKPHYHSTFCAQFHTQDTLTVPPPPVPSSIWAHRTDLSSLQTAPDDGDFSIASNTAIGVREALWLLPAGHELENGYIPPWSYYSPAATDVFPLAFEHLQNSRRGDNIPVAKRAVIYLGDDAGGSWSPNNDGAVNASGAVTFCEDPASAGVSDRSGIHYINMYFAHRSDLLYHADTDGSVISMRSICWNSDPANSDIFIESSETVTSKTVDQGVREFIPLVAQSLKEAELVR